jgi:hypothetical protein
MLVQWVGYDESHNQWVRRSVLEEDVSTLILTYDANPSIFVSRNSAPKRVTKGSPDMVSPAVSRSSRSTWAPSFYCSRHSVVYDSIT